MKTLRDIATEWLGGNGYDGLYDGNGCGCEIDDLMPCFQPNENCTAGHKIPCDPDTCPGDGNCGWHIGQKQEQK